MGSIVVPTFGSFNTVVRQPGGSRADGGVAPGVTRGNGDFSYTNPAGGHAGYNAVGPVGPVNPTVTVSVTIGGMTGVDGLGQIYFALDPVPYTLSSPDSGGFGTQLSFGDGVRAVVVANINRGGYYRVHPSEPPVTRGAGWFLVWVLPR